MSIMDGLNDRGPVAVKDIEELAREVGRRRERQKDHERQNLREQLAFSEAELAERLPELERAVRTADAGVQRAEAALAEAVAKRGKARRAVSEIRLGLSTKIDRLRAAIERLAHDGLGAAYAEVGRARNRLQLHVRGANATELTRIDRASSEILAMERELAELSTEDSERVEARLRSIWKRLETLAR